MLHDIRHTAMVNRHNWHTVFKCLEQYGSICFHYGRDDKKMRVLVQLKDFFPRNAVGKRKAVTQPLILHVRRKFCTSLTDKRATKIFSGTFRKRIKQQARHLTQAIRANPQYVYTPLAEFSFNKIIRNSLLLLIVNSVLRQVAAYIVFQQAIYHILLCLRAGNQGISPLKNTPDSGRMKLDGIQQILHAPDKANLCRHFPDEIPWNLIHSAERSPNIRLAEFVQKPSLTVADRSGVMNQIDFFQKPGFLDVAVHAAFPGFKQEIRKHPFAETLKKVVCIGNGDKVHISQFIIPPPLNSDRSFHLYELLSTRTYR